MDVIPGDDLTMEDMDVEISPELQKLMDLAAQPHTDKQEEAFDVYCRLQRAVRDDDSYNFSCLIDSPALRHLRPPFEVSDIGRDILFEGAVKCAELLLLELSGGIFLDHNFGFSPDGWSALHHACIRPHVPMLEKLLDSGYFDPDLRADMPQDFKFHLLKQALPLNVGLRTFRMKISDIRERSAFSLLHYFYTKMDQDLDAMTLLALNTREFKEEFLNYAKQGKMVELTALLLAAGDKLLPLRISEGGDNKHEFNSFKELRDFLQDNKNRWSSTMSNDAEFAEWKETLTLLDIYDKIGYQLTAYGGLKKCRRSGMEVQDLLKAHGFDVKNGHNNLHNYIHVERSNDASFKFRVPDKNGEFRKLIPKENNMHPLNWMNHKPNESSMPTKPLCDGRKYSTSAAITTPMKSLHAIHPHNSNHYWLSFMRILSKRLRCV